MGKFFLKNVKKKRYLGIWATAGTNYFSAHFFYDKCNFLGQQTWLFGTEHFHNQSTAGRNILKRSVGVSETPYQIFVIFFTLAKFLENKIYTKIYTVNCQFTQ